MIEVRNLTHEKIDAAFLKQVAQMVLRKEKKKGELSIGIINETESQSLNKKYRGKNYPTSVLSFSGGSFALGEVLLCPSVIRRESTTYGMMPRTALAYLLIHGILHLAGYGHEKNAKRMEAKEKHFLSLVS